MPQSSLVPLKLPPGIANNGTTYQNRGRWHLANFMRFFQGSIQPIGGWYKYPYTLSGSNVPGFARSMWAGLNDSSGFVNFVTATTKKLVVSLVGQVNVEANITPTALASSTLEDWTLDNFGNYLIGTANFFPGLAGSGASDTIVWDGNPLHLASTTAMTGAPVGPISIVATPERFVMLLGGDDGAGEDLFRTVFWASQEGYTDWNFSSTTNTAGFFTLATEGALVAGRRGKGETLLWTNKDLWAAVYIGGDLIYSFVRRGDDSGAISAHSPVMLDGRALWMGAGNFFLYDGFVSPIPCEINDQIFGNINQAQAYKVWGISNPQFNEVTWFYPSLNATECDSYVTYNYTENHWVFGTLTRTAGVYAPRSAQISSALLMAGTDGLGNMTMNQHEGIATGIGGASLSYNNEGVAFIESGPVEVGSGDALAIIERLVPDERNFGDVQMTLYARNRPEDAEYTYGPFEMSNEAANVRIKARQVRVRYTTWNAAAMKAQTSPFHYVPRDPITAQATFSRATVADFIDGSGGAALVTAPPIHSPTWRVGDMRLGILTSSRR